jgi:hypothetical protein
MCLLYVPISVLGQNPLLSLAELSDGWILPLLIGRLHFRCLVVYFIIFIKNFLLITLFHDTQLQKNTDSVSNDFRCSAVEKLRF